MLEGFLANTGNYIQTSPWLAVVAVFFGGLITASNPCVLAMIPLMMGFVAGGADERRSVPRALGFSLVFVFGLAVTFTAMGMTAALAGKMYGDISGIWNFVVAAVCVVMGLHLMGALTFAFPTLVKTPPKVRGLAGALILGLLFGLVSAPCAAPILVVLLTYLAGSGASIPFGGVLLLVYALGHSVLIVVAGTSMGAAKAFLASKRATRALYRLRQVAGGIVIFIGLFFAYQGFK